MGEILTIDEVAALLKMSREQVYGMTRSRARERMEKPIPVLRINGNLRFRRSSIEAWYAELEEAQ
jgi:predicted DNA-binding transcriptional regulator AlpA